jgi:hypothetical protein
MKCGLQKHLAPQITHNVKSTALNSSVRDPMMYLDVITISNYEKSQMLTFSFHINLVVVRNGSHLQLAFRVTFV